MAEIPDQKIKAILMFPVGDPVVAGVDSEQNIFGIMILTLESRVVEQGCPLHIRHIDGIMKTWQRFLIKDKSYSDVPSG
jgi:hypothetical protein